VATKLARILFSTPSKPGKLDQVCRTDFEPSDSSQICMVVGQSRGSRAHSPKSCDSTKICVFIHKSGYLHRPLFLKLDKEKLRPCSLSRALKHWY